MSQRDRQTQGRLFGWTAGVTLIFTIIYVLGGQRLVGVLTDEYAVVKTSYYYIRWAWIVPVAGGGLAFIWDGVFIGMTATRGMLVSSFVATLVFFLCMFFDSRTMG